MNASLPICTLPTVGISAPVVVDRSRVAAERRARAVACPWSEQRSTDRISLRFSSRDARAVALVEKRAGRRVRKVIVETRGDLVAALSEQNRNGCFAHSEQQPVSLPSPFLANEAGDSWSVIPKFAESSSNSESQPDAAFERPGASTLNRAVFLKRLAEELDRMFDECVVEFDPQNQVLPFLRPSLSGQGQADVDVSWIPSIDVHEKNGDFVVQVDLPGLNSRNVQLEIVDGVLSVRGERLLPEREDVTSIQHRERVQGRFRRSIPLPQGVDVTKSHASMVDGVMTVTIPVNSRSTVRKVIQIEQTNPSEP